MESKPWYQSKGVIFGLTVLLVFGGNALAGFLTPQVTPEQFDAIQNAEPAVRDIVTKLQNGENWLNLIGSISGLLFTVIRTWFITAPKITAK
jgi:hypothetical protein